MAYNIKQLVNSLEISPVTDIVVTTIEHDEEAGDYYRDIKIFAVDPISEVSAVVAMFRVRGAAADDIEIDVPASQF